MLLIMKSAGCKYVFPLPCGTLRASRAGPSPQGVSWSIGSLIRDLLW